MNPNFDIKKKISVKRFHKGVSRFGIWTIQDDIKYSKRAKIIAEIGVRKIYKWKVANMIVAEALSELKKERQLEFAREMLLDGEPIEKIMKYAKLTIKEIKAVQKELKKEHENV